MTDCNRPHRHLEEPNTNPDAPATQILTSAYAFYSSLHTRITRREDMNTIFNEACSHNIELEARSKAVLFERIGSELAAALSEVLSPGDPKKPTMKKVKRTKALRSAAHQAILPTALIAAFSNISSDGALIWLFLIPASLVLAEAWLGRHAMNLEDAVKAERAKREAANEESDSGFKLPGELGDAMHLAAVSAAVASIIVHEDITPKELEELREFTEQASTLIEKIHPRVLHDWNTAK